MAFIQESNVYSKRMRPKTIVNVSHGVTEYMALRARDFTPARTPKETNSGGAAAFPDFLEHELNPFVDRTWRTMPTDRGLLGHSCAGLFAIFAFGAAACTNSADCRSEPIIAVGWPTAFDRGA